MKTVSEAYLRLLADPEHVREVKVNISGIEYGQDKIFLCGITHDLFPEAAVGSCVSHEMDLTIEPVGSIPTMARVETFGRLAKGEETSEWVPLGVFFIDTRESHEVSGLMDIHGFDGMLKAETVWLDPTEDTGEWPMSQKAAADNIALCMGTIVDPRSHINAALMVEYPNDLTMREVLKYIATSNAGNWSMSGDGNLLLSPLGGLPPETRFLVDNEDGGAILFGEVRLLV